MELTLSLRVLESAATDCAQKLCVRGKKSTQIKVQAGEIGY